MFELIYPAAPAVILPLPSIDNPGDSPRKAGEMVPVVEENGLVVGQSLRKNVHDGSKLMHPVVHLHIVNREGCLYIQKRSMRKDLLPGCWDTAVGGHVDYGESLEEALYREASEELGFKEESLGHNAIAAGVQGQRQWTDYIPNFDFPESLMCTSFDWNGTREANVLATENDSLNGVAMLFGHLLTNKGVMFSDIRTYWSPEAVKRVTGKEATGLAAGGFIHLINSGATTLDATGAMTDAEGNPTMKHHWEMTQEDVEACLKATTWYPACRDYFRGGGYSSNFLTRGGMPMTMIRVNRVKGLGPVIQLAEGWSVDLDPEIHDILNKRTDKTWPTTWFVPRLDASRDAFKDVYSVMNNWGANHGAIAYGHIGADIITLASILRIPVCMHNVADDQVFRPSAWNAFGMDKEGADYRACQNFGPVYK